CASFPRKRESRATESSPAAGPRFRATVCTRLGTGASALSGVSDNSIAFFETHPGYRRGAPHQDEETLAYAHLKRGLIVRSVSRSRSASRTTHGGDAAFA